MSQRRVARGFSLESAGRVSNALDPAAAQDYATKAYVDSAVVGGGGGGGVTELDYVERTTILTVSGSEGAPDTWITGNPVTYDGTTRILVELFSPDVQVPPGTDIGVSLYDGGTNLGRIGYASYASLPYNASRFLTPSAATHTFTAKAWTTTGGSPLLVGGPGGVAPAWMPAYLRITQA